MNPILKKIIKVAFIVAITFSIFYIKVKAGLHNHFIMGCGLVAGIWLLANIIEKGDNDG